MKYSIQVLMREYFDSRILNSTKITIKCKDKTKYVHTRILAFLSHTRKESNSKLLVKNWKKSRILLCLQANKLARQFHRCWRKIQESQVRVRDKWRYYSWYSRWYELIFVLVPLVPLVPWEWWGAAQVGAIGTVGLHHSQGTLILENLQLYKGLLVNRTSSPLKEDIMFLILARKPTCPLPGRKTLMLLYNWPWKDHLGPRLWQGLYKSHGK